MKNKEGLVIIRRKNLTKGQSVLLELIDIKIKNNNKILFIEAQQIWLEKVCRNKMEGKIPYQFNYWLNPYTENGVNKWKGGYEPMSEFEITNRVLSWLVSNIGILVLKGYLKVIPQIEIKQIL